MKENTASCMSSLWSINTALATLCTCAKAPKLHMAQVVAACKVQSHWASRTRQNGGNAEKLHWQLLFDSSEQKQFRPKWGIAKDIGSMGAGNARNQTRQDTPNKEGGHHILLCFEDMKPN